MGLFEVRDLRDVVGIGFGVVGGGEVFTESVERGAVGGVGHCGI